jgi:hypothetical protein
MLAADAVMTTRISMFKPPPVRCIVQAGHAVLEVAMLLASWVHGASACIAVAVAASLACST